MLQSLLWDDEVREADFASLDQDVRVSAKELKMASSLVDNLSADFAPDKFSDEYQEQLRELIAAKLEQGDALDTAATFGEEDDGESGRRQGRRPDGGPPAQRRGEPGQALGSGPKKAPAKKRRQEDRHQEGAGQEDRGQEEVGLVPAPPVRSAAARVPRSCSRCN